MCRSPPVSTVTDTPFPAWPCVVALPGTEASRPRPIDWLGFFLASMAAACVIFGLSVVGLPALPPVFGIVVTLSGILCGVLYVRHAGRHPSPILSLAKIGRAHV